MPRYELWTRVLQGRHVKASSVRGVTCDVRPCPVSAVVPTCHCATLHRSPRRHVVVPPRDVNLISEDIALGASAAAVGAA